MEIIKRDGRTEAYLSDKITTAIGKAFASVPAEVEQSRLNELTVLVEAKLIQDDGVVQVETIQDLVEATLMEQGYYEVSKNYILYRNEHAKRREIRRRLAESFAEAETLSNILKGIQIDFAAEEYSLEKLQSKFSSFKKPSMTEKEKLAALIKAAVELTTQEAPQWELISARLQFVQFDSDLTAVLEQYELDTFAQKVHFLVVENLYGAYIPEHYTDEELNQAAQLIDNSRNELLSYSGLTLLLSRYVIRSTKGEIFETPQEMFLGIALHLAMKEKNNRMGWVKRFYDMLSTLKVTMATPTLSNARKPFYQLSSCFIDTVPDSLTGIYRSIDNFAQVSKFGGGMGMYFGKVRATGSTIRGFKGAAGGVIRWIKLANDTAVAVDQLGVRQGAVAVYLDAWHKDLPEFLALRTNNGDDRMKAHDVFPAVCYPDLFWKMARENLDSNWYLMCPHEIMTVKGYCLEDSWGDEWEERYRDCVEDERIEKRVISVKDLVRLILKSAVETGTPFAFNRDAVNRMNPNSHKGVIYCSNLCTEIAQNMSAIDDVSQTVKIVDGEEIVVTVTKPGNFVVCNLASLSLGKIDVDEEGELEELTESAVRALDNVIDLNFFPVPYAKINNQHYRPIGLGVSGYHHMLAKHKISWEREEHLAFADKIFERINYAAIAASCHNAEEKGAYDVFEGSDWQTGAYFDKRNYTGEKWNALRREVAEKGLRNGYLMAIAPTSSTSIISGTTAGIDPIMNLFFLEEKKNGLMPRVAPDLSIDTLWYYKNAHHIDQSWSVRAAGVRQRHIDQSQSMNLYITNEYSFRQVLGLYILAFEQGIKTIYYVRSKSLEVEECEVCSS
ncbi:ribonucleoside-diphosphate reductase subunit alpha [Scatolibacter rhodanostii]|uniref:ribonucleoside-diphosphate reductase subunit alpha n=1 Tax=Scatolibacter rhodanostii TaxID=2014781 RepID=UPI000C06D7DE|nr:ribonucleoside-diphosphate reductase subunit alpha [Scatolibacter rhodanostii]